MPNMAGPRGDSASRGSACADRARKRISRPVMGPVCAALLKVTSKRCAIACDGIADERRAALTARTRVNLRTRFAATCRVVALGIELERSVVGSRNVLRERRTPRQRYGLHPAGANRAGRQKEPPASSTSRLINEASHVSQCALGSKRPEYAAAVRRRGWVPKPFVRCLAITVARPKRKARPLKMLDTA